MASASNSGCSNPSRHPNKKSPDDLAKKNHDAELLDEPYAQAVQAMGYSCHDILQAIKCLQKRGQPMTAKDVLQELMKMESEGRLGISGASVASASSSSSSSALSPTPKKCLKRPAASYGSDGEENFDSLEEDCAGEEVKRGQSRGEEEERKRGGGVGEGGGRGPARSDTGLAVAEAREGGTPERPPPQKKPTTKDHASGGRKKMGEEEGAAELRRRVLALREENRLLKARHMCRKCGEQPVTLTFLPCGHFSFCQDCGQSFNTCPICRKPVLADVRTFLA